MFYNSRETIKGVIKDIRTYFAGRYLKRLIPKITLVGGHLTHLDNDLVDELCFNFGDKDEVSSGVCGTLGFKGYAKQEDATQSGRRFLFCGVFDGPKDILDLLSNGYGKGGLAHLDYGDHYKSLLLEHLVALINVHFENELEEVSVRNWRYVARYKDNTVVEINKKHPLSSISLSNYEKPRHVNEILRMNLRLRWPEFTRLDEITNDKTKEVSILRNFAILASLFDQTKPLDAPLRRAWDNANYLERRVLSNFSIYRENWSGINNAIYLKCKTKAYVALQMHEDHDVLYYEQGVKGVTERLVKEMAKPLAGKTFNEAIKDVAKDRCGLLSILRDTSPIASMFNEIRYPTPVHECLKNFMKTGGFDETVLRSINVENIIELDVQHMSSSVYVTAYIDNKGVKLPLANVSGNDIAHAMTEEFDFKYYYDAYMALQTLMSRATKVAEKHFRYGGKV